MTAPSAHRWDLDPAEARALQARLRAEVREEPVPETLDSLAGVDVGFEQGGAVTRAAAVLLSAESLALRAWRVVRRATVFPYVPGLLSFREVPALVEALAALPAEPDLVFCDGQGYAHPRRFGLACHLGVLTGLRTVGVAKSRLIGESGPPPRRRGDWVPLTLGEETLGAVLCTRDGVRPLYVSVGHRVTLRDAIAWVLRAGRGRRLPEPIRLADRLANGRDIEAGRAPLGGRASA